jgi:hypothetical protein
MDRGHAATTAPDIVDRRRTFVECVANARVFLPGDAVTHGAITELRNPSPLSIEETNQAN